jgi:hypothetical protein
MTHEFEVTTVDPYAVVTPDPDIPGRYEVLKTTITTTTTVTRTLIDVKVLPDRTVTFGFNAANGTVAELQKMIDAYGQPDVCRVFSSPGKGIMAWDNPLLQLLKDDCVLVYSWKDWPLTAGAFENWMTTKPTNRFPKVWWCIDHEPEQGPDSGDPDPSTYRRQWTETLAIRNAHPRRDEFPPVAIFTEFYARKYDSVPNPTTGKTWHEDFGVVLGFEGMRGSGWDIYESGYPEFKYYRTPEHRNEIPLKYSEMYNLPMLVCELNVGEKSAVDPDGSIAAQAMLDNAEYLRNQVEHPVPYVMWFHTGGGVLYNSPARFDAFLEILSKNPE